MIIRSDGTYTFSPHTDGSRSSQSGKYWFEGSVFNILNDFCGKPDKYSLKRNDVTGQPATLSFTVIADDCAGEVRILIKQPPVPVEP